MKNIIFITDPKILAIPIVECHEPLIDLKQQQEIAYGTPPETELTANCYTKLRTTVYKKLCQAQNKLPHGWRFLLFEGFRSRAVQKILFDEVYQRMQKMYPEKNHAEIFYDSMRLISPIKNLDGTPNIAAHNTGGAIDVEIISADGELIDMGMVVKDWNTVEPDVCLTEYAGLTPIAKSNRLVLLEVLTQQGFINYPTEWWHFSYGDRYWAYHTKQPHAIYGSADDVEIAAV